MKNFTFLAIFLLSYTALASAQTIDTSHTYLADSLALNMDGARHAYHPNNEGFLHNLNGGIKKEDALQNRFKKTSGYGIAKKRIANSTLDEGYIQPDGYYVSQTSRYNRHLPDSTPGAYADAETIPYITLSPHWKAKGIRNCDIAYVVNLQNGKRCAAIFADYRKNDRKVEISLALAQALSIPVTTKKAKSYDGQKTVTRYVGIYNHRLKIYYFKKSGDGSGKTPEEIEQMGKRLMGLE